MDGEEEEGTVAEGEEPGPESEPLVWAGKADWTAEVIVETGVPETETVKVSFTTTVVVLSAELLAESLPDSPVETGTADSTADVTVETGEPETETVKVSFTRMVVVLSAELAEVGVAATLETSSEDADPAAEEDSEEERAVTAEEETETGVEEL